MNLANLDYMLRLIDMHGTDILNTGKQVYSKKFKEQAIEQAIFGTKSYVQLSLELGFKSIAMLIIWLREYKENGYNVIIKQKGRPARGQRESEITQGTGERDPKAERRKLAIAYCERIRKKTESLGSRKRSEQIAKAITDLRHEFKVSLDYVLEAIAEHPGLPIIARSSYYKIIKRKPKKPKRSKLIAKIKEIFKKSAKNMIAASLIMKDLKGLKKEMDYNEYGGAPIMGAAKPVFKAHGSSKAKTIKSALRLTKAYVEGNVVQEIADSIQALKGEGDA